MTNAKILMQLFEHWKISTDEQLDLLGLASAGHFLAIHKNLRLLFPHNRELAYRWMSTQNKAFEGRTPIEVVKASGLAGLLVVRSYLDGMVGQ